MGLFPSHKEAPRVVVTNGMVILIILNRMIGRK
jgi:urocanate hydratase